MVLIGDSHAEAISSMVRDVATDSGISLGAWTGRACNLSLRVTDYATARCVAYTNSVIEWINRLSPDIVVLHQVHYGRDETPKKADEYLTGLVEVLSRLSSTKLEIIIVEDVPRLGSSRIQRASIVNPDPDPSRTRTEEVLGDAQFLRDRMMRIADPRVTFVKSLEHVCDAVFCSQKRQGTWIYRDSNHLTLAGARLLQAPFEAAVTRILQETTE